MPERRSVPARAAVGAGPGAAEDGAARRSHGDRHRDQPQDPGETEGAGSLPPPAAGGWVRLWGQAQPVAEAPGSGRPPSHSCRRRGPSASGLSGEGGSRRVGFVGSGVGAPLYPEVQLPGAVSGGAQLGRV